MNAYLRMFRMGNVVMGCIGALVAAFIAAGSGVFDNIYGLVVLVAIIFPFIAGGNSLNDGIDAEIDKVSHPERPVPRGEITPDNAKKTGILLLALSVVISFATLKVSTIIFVLIAAILMVSYELRLKQTGFAGNVIIAVLTGMVFLVGADMVASWYDSLFIAIMVASVSIGREISKDIEDMGGDAGRNTLPMRIGVRKAAIISCIFSVIGVCMSIMPIVWNTVSILYCVVILADICFIIAAYKVFSDPTTSQKMSKKGMLFGLLAFILGAISI